MDFKWKICGNSRYTVWQRVVDDTRRLWGGVVLDKVTGNIHQSRHVIVDVVELQTYLGHFLKLMHHKYKHQSFIVSSFHKNI